MGRSFIAPNPFVIKHYDWKRNIIAIKHNEWQHNQVLKQLHKSMYKFEMHAGIHFVEKIIKEASLEIPQVITGQ